MCFGGLGRSGDGIDQRCMRSYFLSRSLSICVRIFPVFTVFLTALPLCIRIIVPPIILLIIGWIWVFFLEKLWFFFFFNPTRLALQAALNKHPNLQTAFLLWNHLLRLKRAYECLCKLIRICTTDCVQQNSSACAYMHARGVFLLARACAYRVCAATVCACVSIIAPSPTASPGSWQLDNSFLLFQSRAPERTNMIINHYSNRKVRRGAQASKRAW